MAAVHVFLLLFCVSSAVAGLIPVQSECTLGPVFWCQDLHKAVQCGAVQQCMQTAWSQQAENNDVCSDCTKIIELMMDMLSNHDTQARIKGTLHSVCSQLPGAGLVAECDKLVDSSLPIAIRFIMDHVKPGAVCFALGLCTPQQSGKGMQELLTNEISETGYIVSEQAPLPWPASQLELQASPQCTLCLLIIRKLEDMLPKERTEDTVVKLLEQICSHLPSEVSQECQDFVDKYGKTVIDFLLSSMAPHTICTLLHLCFGVESPVPVISTVSDCEVCDSLVSKVKLSLGTNVTAPEYEAVMDAVCYSYQPAFHECKSFVQSYKHQLLKVLGKPWDSQTTCKQVEACVTVKTVPLLGTKECTWGPSYWCTDMQTAKECNAVEHCQAHVWN
ncbi:prosaposin-like [Polyodon spathula]|uniref:prosaposin-like n=1 Tax=Polyodon spathula TaxID=7913 RepID=UPI001B7E4BB5|nr:prosaposin-like [Polyodon spathula]